MATDLPRVLDVVAVSSLDVYVTGGGGTGLVAAAERGPAGTTAELEASGLRGRGGAGFPTGTKWRTIVDTGVAASRVVVNAAEGEPGSLKDRTLLARNPYRVLEGALIAAATVGAPQVLVALKATSTKEIETLERAIAELGRAGWGPNVEIAVLPGPGEYLFGEETALLEVAAGRPPFPRLAPPYRDGVSEPPTLANNVETLANVALIMANGADWFRQVGTAESPGTVVCTISGSVRHAGVQEVVLGTPLSAVIDDVGGGTVEGTGVRAVLSGVSHPLLPASKLDTPLTYEDMEAAGSGLGAAGFIVFDDGDDLVAVTQGVARFLAVESCGQCTPCKQDGLAIADLLDRFRRSNGTEDDVEVLSSRIDTVTDGARCFLAHQQQRVVGSLLALFPEELAAHMEQAEERRPAVAPVVIAELLEIVDGRAKVDQEHATKQPDWTFDAEDSGTAPAERMAGPDDLDDARSG